MIYKSTISQAWRLLESDERTLAYRLLIIISIAALFNALMIASVWPFLKLLSDPNILETNLYFSNFFEYFNLTDKTEFVVYSGVFSFFVIISSTVFQVWRIYAVSNFALMRTHTLSIRLFDRYLNSSYEVLKKHKKADILTKIMSETQQVVLQVFRPAANIVASIVNITLITAFLLIVNWQFTIIVFGTLALFYGSVIFTFKRKIKRLGAQRLRQNQLCFNIVSDTLSGIKEVKFNTIEDKFRFKFFDATRAMAKSHVSAQVLGEIPNYLLQGITFAGTILAMLALIDFEGVIAGDGLGGIIPLLGVFAFAGQRIIPEMQKIYNGYTQFQYASESVNAIHEALQTVNEPATANISKALDFREKIEFKNVSYVFSGSDEPFIKEVSFMIPVGSNVGIVGTSGSGKTTLVDLLLGLLSPTSGEIFIDQEKLTNVNIVSWRQNCAYVPQEVAILSGSFAENIKIASNIDNTSIELLQKSIDIAQLKEVINGTTQGVETVVGDGNKGLSGGQKQRLGIARAVYKNAQLFVLDEGTSALDNITETKLINKLQENYHDITTINIAHRLSTVRKCDMIIVMENGKIIGIGDWDSLRKSNKAFQSLVENGDLN